MRNGVRALFKQIALVYPVSKLFLYVMEGLKSKNARQRTGRRFNSQFSYKITKVNVN